MADFRETIPTVSGPGAFLIFLIFLALILTSDSSRQKAFNWDFAVALVAISIPASIFITQIYHAYFTKFGFNKKDFGEMYKGYRKYMHVLDVMIDYKSHQKDKGTKEWVIIQKKATTYHLFNMLRYVSFLFLCSYIIFLYWNESSGHIISIFWRSLWGVGVALMCIIAFFSAILFHLCCKDVWKIWMELDKKLIKDFEPEIIEWINEVEWIKKENNKTKNKN